MYEHSVPFACSHKSHFGPATDGWRRRQVLQEPTWKVPARVVKVAGMTLSFYEGCNKCRARQIKDMLREMAVTRKPRLDQHDVCLFSSDWKPPLCGNDWYEAHCKDELPEQDITIEVDGQSFTRNVAFKAGDIKEFIGEFCKPGRATRIRKGPTAAERRSDALGAYMIKVLS